MPTVRGTMHVTSWDEQTYEERGEGAKLTRASVVMNVTGELAGDAGTVWLMSYRPDGTARFVGLQRVNGTIGDRQGGFVLDSLGEFDGKVAAADVTIVPGSGTAGFAGIRGGGRFEAPMGSEATFLLDYEVE